MIKLNNIILHLLFLSILPPLGTTNTPGGIRGRLRTTRGATAPRDLAGRHLAGGLKLGRQSPSQVSIKKF